MKLNDIKDKRRILAKTPTNNLIKAITVSLVSGTFLLGGYIIVYHKDTLEKISKKLSNTLNIEAKLNEKAKKPSQGLQYRQYIEEKRAYEKELELETIERLKSIKERLNKSKLPEQQQPLPSTIVEVASKPKSSLKSIILHYISFGYWKKKTD
jgi:hydrogenase maturation factor